MMRLIKSFVLLVLMSLPVAAGVEVSTIEYEGWQGAVEIKNAEVRLVVVPSIGRIMHYGFADGQNILWSDPQFHGQVLPDG